MNALSTPSEVGEMSTAMLIDYIVQRFHTGHRDQLPELIHMARRVGQVHASHPHCPRGLADALEAHFQELESHMLKEEQILFPLLRNGGKSEARVPISVMLLEHDQHLATIERIQALTNGVEIPDGACGTWRRLYEGVAHYLDELRLHIHTENDVLFAKALAADAAQGGEHA